MRPCGRLSPAPRRRRRASRRRKRRRRGLERRLRRRARSGTWRSMRRRGWEGRRRGWEGRLMPSRRHGGSRWWWGGYGARAAPRAFCEPARTLCLGGVAAARGAGGGEGERGGTSPLPRPAVGRPFPRSLRETPTDRRSRRRRTKRAGRRRRRTGSPPARAGFWKDDQGDRWTHAHRVSECE